jgi:hypothetical protein
MTWDKEPREAFYPSNDLYGPTLDNVFEQVVCVGFAITDPMPRFYPAKDKKSAFFTCQIQTCNRTELKKIDYVRYAIGFGNEWGLIYSELKERIKLSTFVRVMAWGGLSYYNKRFQLNVPKASNFIIIEKDEFVEPIDPITNCLRGG